jgi:hypothetical protein
MSADLTVGLSREMAEALQALIGHALDEDHDDPSGGFLAERYETTEATLLGAAKAIEAGRLAAREALAATLIERYGEDPQEVGAEDGTEDDFGDLISEAVSGLGYDAEAMFDTDPARWERVQEAASVSVTTDMTTWLGELAAALGEESTMRRLTTGEGDVMSLSIGRITNDELEAAVAVWHKNEDTLAGEVIGPIFIEVAHRASGSPAPHLIPFTLATVTAGREMAEWFPLSTAEALAKALKVEVRES